MEQTRIKIADFSIPDFIASPWNVRRVAKCPACGAGKTERCITQGEDHKTERFYHPERKAEATRNVKADIERLKAVEKLHAAGYGSHDRMVAAAKALGSIGVTLADSPDTALKIYQYAQKRGEVQDDFLSLIP